MFQRCAFLVGVAVGLSLLAVVGCSSGGNGGDDGEGTALSLDGETAMPATGGASIAADRGVAFSTVISSMLAELAVDAQSTSAATKLNAPLEICPGGGNAVLDGVLEGGETASLTLTDCVGSPLGGTANGTLLLGDLTESFVGTTLEASATASLSGRGDSYPEFTIAPGTVLTGNFKVQADITLSFSPAITASQVDLVLGRSEPESSSDDWILVADASGTELRVTCFEISTSIDTSPFLINSFQPQGVLVLEGDVYTFNSADIGFDVAGGSPIPVSGTIELSSGDQLGCGFGSGDGSSVQAELYEEGATTFVNVTATGADGTVYACTEQWENLLATLSDLNAFERCPPAVAGDVLTCASDALLDFNAYLDELIEVFKQVDSPGSQNDFLIDWESDPEAGLFNIGIDLDGGGPERDLSGRVTPKDRCQGGMETDDVCIVKWTVNMRTPSAEEVAYGGISARKFEPTAQNPTGSTRLTIVSFDPPPPPPPSRTNMVVVHSANCSMEVSLFDMLWRLRTEPAEFYSFSLGFDATTGRDSARGDVIWGTAVGEDATITFNVDGERIVCDFDLDTFRVSCP
jgi:hypothetical protein